MGVGTTICDQVVKTMAYTYVMRMLDEGDDMNSSDDDLDMDVDSDTDELCYTSSYFISS